MTWRGSRGGDRENMPEGKIREGMLDRLLGFLVRPRVEAPLERAVVTAMGHTELRWRPLRFDYAAYTIANGGLDKYIWAPYTGGRVKLAQDGSLWEIPDGTLQVFSPLANTSYWLVTDEGGGVHWISGSPESWETELATLQTFGTFPAAPTAFRGVVPTYADLGRISSRNVGDQWAIMSDRSTYYWNGSAWVLFLQLTDQRPDFIPRALPIKAFRSVHVGSAYITAGSSSDILELAAGTGVTLTPDTGAKKVTIAATGNSNAMLRARLKRTSSFFVSGPNAWVPIAWSAAEFDNASMWNAGTPTLLTIPSNGLYQITARVSWGTSLRRGRMQITGYRPSVSTNFVLIEHEQYAHSNMGVSTYAGGYTHEATTTAELQTGDQIDVRVYYEDDVQTLGVYMANFAPAVPEFSIVRLSD